MPFRLIGGSRSDKDSHEKVIIDLGTNKQNKHDIP